MELIVDNKNRRLPQQTSIKKSHNVKNDSIDAYQGNKRQLYPLTTSRQKD